MSHAQCTRLDRIPLRPPHSTPSLLYPPNRTIICNPQQKRVQFGRLAEQSPLIPSRLAVRRSRQCCDHREEEVLCRLTTLVKTLPLLLQHRKWMNHRFGNNVGFTAGHTDERGKCSSIQDLITPTKSNVSRSSHVPTIAGRPVAMCSLKRRSSREPNVLRSLILNF